MENGGGRFSEHGFFARWVKDGYEGQGGHGHAHALTADMNQ
jgi:hypothetical protein